MARVAFIGTGVMGSSMAQRLLGAGHSVAVFNRTPDKAAPLGDVGAEVVRSIAEATADADFAVTIVGYPEDVQAVWLSPDGLLAELKPGTVAIDMTTSRPSLARELHAEGAKRGIDVLDAPVSGGDVGAREGTLSIMVGGDEAAFTRALPLFEAMGSRVVLQGPAGSGQHTKMANQVVIAGTMIGVMEALRYVRAAGMDPATVLESIGAGAAGSWTLSNLYPRVVRGDFAPGFFVRHYLKDLEIAAEEAEERGLELRGLAMARELYRQLIEAGLGDEGTQALYKII